MPERTSAALPPIRDRTALERAMAEAAGILEAKPAPGSAEEQRFLDLLQRISNYQGDGLDAPGSPAIQALERRLREASRHYAEQHPDKLDPWSPMVGGDLPHGAHRPPRA